MELLRAAASRVAGRRAVVLGRSDIVGKPMALLLLHADATVTVCHSRTRDLPAVTREADLLVAAIGRAGLRARRTRQAGRGGGGRGHEPDQIPRAAADLLPESRRGELERRATRWWETCTRPR